MIFSWRQTSLRCPAPASPHTILAACSAAASSRAMASLSRLSRMSEDATRHCRGGDEHQARADTGHPSSAQTRRTTVARLPVALGYLFGWLSSVLVGLSALVRIPLPTRLARPQHRWGSAGGCQHVLPSVVSWVIRIADGVLHAVGPDHLAALRAVDRAVLVPECTARVGLLSTALDACPGWAGSAGR